MLLLLCGVVAVAFFLWHFSDRLFFHRYWSNRRTNVHKGTRHLKRKALTLLAMLLDPQITGPPSSTVKYDTGMGAEPIVVMPRQSLPPTPQLELPSSESYM